MKKIPLHSLVLMVGPSGAGKSTVARDHFEDYEIVSSDNIRHELVGDFQRQDINYMVFREVERRASIKLKLGERVVVDATHLHKRDRMNMADVGVNLGVPVFYIVVNRALNEKTVTGGWRNEVSGLIERHDAQFVSSEREILRGDNIATVIDTRRETFEVVKKLPKGDIMPAVRELGYKGLMAIGDVHGMRESLKNAVDWASARNLFMVFLGDIVDYGPDSLDCVDIAYDIVARGRGVNIIGNHERKIERWIQQVRKGEVKLKLSEGNKATTRLVEALSERDRARFESKFSALLSFARHHVVAGDTLFTHGGAEPEMFDIQNNRLHGRLESIALYGELDPVNQFRDDGYPNRIYEWVNRVPNGKRVVVGHDIRSSIKPLIEQGSAGGEAIFMDTGSGKGGHLTTAHMMFAENGACEIKAFTAH